VFPTVAPVAGAMVQAYEGQDRVHRRRWKLCAQRLPLGAYLLKASKVIDGMLNSAQVNINLQVCRPARRHHATAAAGALPHRADLHRLLRRDEETFGSDELLDPGPEISSSNSDRDKLSLAHPHYHWGGEAGSNRSHPCASWSTHTSTARCRGRCLRAQARTPTISRHGQPDFQRGRGRQRRHADDHKYRRGRRRRGRAEYFAEERAEYQ